MASQYISTLTSFSGADLVVTVGPKVIGELQSISWAIQREKAPIYTFGSSDPRSFSRGKRGIAGSLVFAVFDRDALLIALRDIWDTIAPVAMFTAAGNIATQGSEDFKNALNLASWAKAGEAKGNALAGTANGGAVGLNKTAGSNNKYDAATDTWGTSTTQVNLPAGFDVIRGENVLYADQVPPFDVTLTFANEYGQAAFQKIYDVDILNEGSGVSVDTIVMERQMTYIARRISPLTSGVFTRSDVGAVKGKSITAP